MNMNEKNLYKTESDFRSGFIAVMGKANVGKSTLINRIIGRKVSIVSSKPQTTRRRVMGVKNGSGYQMVFVDTPGIHNPTHQLGRFMEKTYTAEISEADVILLVADCTYPPDSEDQKAVKLIAKSKKNRPPLVLAINKIDAVDPAKLKIFIESFEGRDEFAAIFEVSALDGSGAEKLCDFLKSLLNPGPAYFPQDMLTDQTLEMEAAEVVREKILLKTRREIPHGVFVHTLEAREGETPDIRYFKIAIYTEKESQKKILIGSKGQMLKEIGTLAREELESRIGSRVFLDLWVKVKENWKDRKDLLKSWGYVI